MEILLNTLKTAAFLIDQVVYGLIPTAYDLIFYLANINLFNAGGEGALMALINRVYLLLGIFMLFKVAFSLIKYMIDPNAFNDKAKGFGKLITNTLVAIVLLILTPVIFETAYNLQSDIILSNAIPRLILGDKSYVDYTDPSNLGNNNQIDTTDLEKQQAGIHSMGVDLQFTVFSAFYTVNTDDKTSGYWSCRPTTEKPLMNVLGSSDMVAKDENGNDSECWSDIKSDLTAELHEHGGTLRRLFKYKASAKLSDTDPSKCTNEICDERDFSVFGKLLWWTKAGGESPAVIKYFPIVSSIVGGYLLLLLVSFLFDIAARLFKLLFLEMIAPIAIISYMDPGESINNGKFHKWLLECGKTYVSLFLRLAVLYCVIQLVRVIISSVYSVGADGTSLYYNGLAPTGTLNMFVYVFLILGVFIFAKRVPLMIENIFGFKLTGEMSLNPLKNSFVAAGLGMAGAGFGMLAANTLSTASRFNRWRKDNGGLSSALENGIGRISDNTLATGRNVRAAARGIFSEAENANLGRQSYGAAIMKSMGHLKWRGGMIKDQWKDTAAGARTAASSVAGIATGAASGAVRGAIGGSKASDIKSIANATSEAIEGAADARNRRTTRRESDKFTIHDQAMDRVRNFAKIKNKEAGVGAADKEITQLTRAMENLREEEVALRRSRAQQTVEKGLDPRALEMAIYRGTRGANGQLVRAIDDNGDPAPLRTYNEYITEFNSNPSAFGGGSPISQDAFDSYRLASESIDSYDKQQAEMRRTISDLTKLKDQFSKDKK